MISESPNILDLLIQGHFCRIKKSAQVAAVYEQAVKNLADLDCLIARRWRGEYCRSQRWRGEYQHLAQRCRGAAMEVNNGDRVVNIGTIARRCRGEPRGDGGVNIGDRAVNFGIIARPRRCRGESRGDGA